MTSKGETREMVGGKVGEVIPGHDFDEEVELKEYPAKQFDEMFNGHLEGTLALPSGQGSSAAMQPRSPISKRPF